MEVSPAIRDAADAVEYLVAVRRWLREQGTRSGITNGQTLRIEAARRILKNAIDHVEALAALAP